MSSTPSPLQRLRITVNGKAYVVEIGELTASPITVTVNGRPYIVNIETTEHLSGTSVETVPPDEPAAAPPSPSRYYAGQRAPDPPGTPRGYSADGQANVGWAPSGGRAPSEVRAPMPGNILDITVKPGDKVSIRQQLCSLEAMKMKNAIHSPQDGVIASVEVTEGQAVAYGDVLFTFEPATPSGYSAGK